MDDRMIDAEGARMNEVAPLRNVRLSRYEAARTALAEAVRIDEVKEIIDRAAALEEYARRAKDVEMINNATELRLTAERKGGEILIEMAENGERADRGRRDQMSRAATFTLKDLEVSRDQSSKWQKLAKLPADKFEIRVEHAQARVRAMTTSTPHLIRKGDYTGENEWFTPSVWIERARQAMGGIDLDPASHVIAQETVRAKTFYTVADDGLEQPWFGRVFINPPYERRLLKLFAGKLLSSYASGVVSQAILLTNASCSDVGWFHSAARAAAVVCFPRGRVKFLSPAGDGFMQMQGQVFFYFGADDAGFRRTFGEVGVIMRALEGTPS
jgi:DNA N-6-adenine-methyltransferase (Dam)